MKKVVSPTANNLVHFHLHEAKLSVDNGEQASRNATKRRKMAHGNAGL